ncbi:rCG32199 [Rattus norvegicus]|uniref:RCG32199 n=1 Tax=Rattus norvegicus TaxID=10116 RepID=A6JXD1_RAT|nr:rCG32199 [Rattus norvegicus]
MLVLRTLSTVGSSTMESKMLLRDWPTRWCLHHLVLWIPR